MFDQPKVILPVIEPIETSILPTNEVMHPAIVNYEVECKKVFLATILHGITRGQCVSIHNHLGFMTTVTETQWQKLLNNFKPKILMLAQNSMTDAIAEEMNYSKPDTNFKIMSDGSWNVRGFTSPLGTVSALGLNTKKVVGVSVLINEGKLQNCDVSSKAMEGLGTEKICKFFKDNGANVTDFLHDGDGSAFNGVLKYFPNSKELRCINHAAKNLGKWAKEVLGDRFSSKVRYAFWHACRNASNAPDPEFALKKEFEIMLNHFGGIHTICKHHTAQSKPQKWYLDAAKIEVFRRKPNRVF